jgi:hypothetical protein
MRIRLFPVVMIVVSRYLRFGPAAQFVASSTPFWVLWGVAGSPRANWHGIQYQILLYSDSENAFAIRSRQANFLEQIPLK